MAPILNKVNRNKNPNPIEKDTLYIYLILKSQNFSLFFGLVLLTQLMYLCSPLKSSSKYIEILIQIDLSDPE